jgi:hypothetical protein
LRRNENVQLFAFLLMSFALEKSCSVRRRRRRGKRVVIGLGMLFIWLWDSNCDFWFDRTCNLDGESFADDAFNYWEFYAS